MQGSAGLLFKGPLPVWNSGNIYMYNRSGLNKGLFKYKVTIPYKANENTNKLVRFKGTALNESLSKGFDSSE